MAPMVHTSLESFMLLQTLRPYNPEPFIPSFERVSDSLKSNGLLQENDSADLNRLDPKSLKDLYLSLMKEEAKIEAIGRHESPQKGDNPRKRKLSSPKLETIDEASGFSHLLPKLASRLYDKYREETIKSIEDEERTYRSLEKGIQELERDEKNARASRPLSQGVPSISALLRDTEDSAQPRHLSPSTRPNTNGLAQGPSSAENHVTHHKPRNIHADIYKPLPQPGLIESGPSFLPPFAPPGHGYPLPSPGIDRRDSAQNHRPSPSPRLNQAILPQREHSSASPIILPPPVGMGHPSGSTPGPLDALADMAGQQYRTNTAMPPSHYHPPRQHPTGRHPVSQQYPSYYDNPGFSAPYPAYSHNQVPIYHPHAGSMQPYHASAQNPSHHPQYGASPYQSPLPSQHAAYYPPQGQYPAMQTPYGQQAPRYFDRTSVSGTTARPNTIKSSPNPTSSSSTKWKRIDGPGSARTPQSRGRPRSRSISPISDPDASPKAEDPLGIFIDDSSTRKQQSLVNAKDYAPSVKTAKGSQLRGTQPRGAGTRTRSGRAGSAASSTVRDRLRRSHSVVDELAANQAQSNRRIKPEEDSASVASLTGDESSRKFLRRRGNLRSHDPDPPRTNAKRKRSAEPAPSTPTRRSRPQGRSPSSEAVTLQRPAPAIIRPGYILATRNFPRISLPLMNEITSHRLASLFAKPLTDRDAPGYKDLIYRRQDLKSIKTAIAAGSRALTAAIEELADSPVPSVAQVWVPENDDLMPPKGIVNAAQLDKELMRIFANAVMFNPDVASNRGIGPAFRTRQQRRHIAMSLTSENANPNRALDEITALGTGGSSPTATSETNGSGLKFEIGVAAPVEGAVVQDTRAVARDVQDSFASWRAVERQGEGVAAAAAGTPRRLRGEDEVVEVVEDDPGMGVKESVELEHDREPEHEDVEEAGERRSKRRRR